jgi:RHS repeat-associated protein
MLDGSIAYDDERRVTRETNSLGHVTAHHFTEKLRPLRQTDPLGRTTTFTWDAFDNRTSVTDPLGRTTRYRYDEAGNLVELRRPDGAVLTATWNERRQPVTTVGADGARVEREYGDRGNLLAVTEPDGAHTRYLYDDHGRFMAIIDAVGQVTRIETDTAGLPITVLDPLGAATSYERDALGRILTATDPIGGITRYTWTPEGNLTARTLPDGATDTFRYDPEGNLVEHVDPAGLVTTIEITHFDLAAARTGPDGARLAFRYDTELRLTAVTNPQGLVWRYDYDTVGQLTTETDFNGRVLRYTYDAAGQLATRTNGAGETVTFTRNALGDVVEKHGPDGSTTFAYDAAGRVTRAAGPDAEVTFERDPAGRVTAETIDGRRLSSTYDRLGRRTRRTTASGAVSDWTYDGANQPLTLHTAGHLLRFTHDAAGRERERTLTPAAGAPGTSVALTQTWDPNHQLLSQTITAETIRVADPSGLGTPGRPGPTGAATSIPSPASTLAGRQPASSRLIQRRDFAYSADGYLTEIDDLVSGLRRFDLDPMRRVTAVTGAGWQERYAYDPAGNVTDAHWPTRHPPNQPDAPDERGTRDYTGTLIRRAGAVRYEHDAQGRITLRQRKRLTGKPHTWRYAWNADDRLTTVTTPNGTTWHYRYDPFGRRTAKHRVDALGHTLERITFTWDGPTLAEQHHLTDIDKVDPPPGANGQVAAASPTVTTWDWEPDTFRPLTQSTHRPSDGADHAWYDLHFHAIVTDLIGTPTELLAPDGTLAWHARRTLWGITPPSASDAADCPLRFPGQYHDPESGLNYNYHRHYDPTTARYESPDPLGLAPGPNPDAYVANPAVWIDPLGLSPCDVLTRDAARREAMRLFGLPTSRQPIAQVATKAGYQYVYEHTVDGGVTRLVTVTEQTTDRVPGHGPHWEVGFAKDLGYGRDPLGRLRVHNGKIKVDYAG